MNEVVKIKIDGRAIEARPGQTIMEAADAAGIYIPRLCSHPDLKPIGSCRVCTVVVDGRPQAACVKPVMDGMEAAQRIRRGEAGEAHASTPIVALTAYAMNGDRERFLQAGMEDYISKPVSMAELERVLGRFAEQLAKKVAQS